MTKKKPSHRPKGRERTAPKRQARSERDILAELQALCVSPGYVHALAALCFRDNTLICGPRLTEDDLRERFNPSRLLRTEINTLVGLMLKGPIDWTLPSPKVLSEYVAASDRLLQELHDAMSGAFSLSKLLAAAKRGERANPFDSGDAMREPIYYAAESAYNFQYVDLAAKRYAADAEWLQANVGFTIDEACKVAESIDRVLMDRFPEAMMALRQVPIDQWTMLPMFCVMPSEVAAHRG